MRGTLLRMLLIMTLLLATGATAAVSVEQSTADLDLPDLVPLAPFDIVNGQTDDGSGPAVRFAFATANRGEFPLDILPEVTGDEFAPAHQCVRWAAPRLCLEREEVGGIVWHEPHGHYHFDDYAQYELREVDEHGEPVWDDDGLVDSSEKVSFCLVDTHEYPDHEAGPAYATPFYLSCFARLGFMGITPGWMDIYPPSRPGQQIPLSGVPDGTYALVAILDPNELLFVADRSDHTVYSLIRVTGEHARPVR